MKQLKVRRSHTLSIEKVANRNRMPILVGMDGGISEHFIRMHLRSDTHVFLAQMSHMSVDIRVGLIIYELEGV